VDFGRPGHRDQHRAYFPDPVSSLTHIALHPWGSCLLFYLLCAFRAAASHGPVPASASPAATGGTRSIIVRAAGGGVGWCIPTHSSTLGKGPP
jgi:hypothetical protein